jgi:hypothetical protein
VSHEPAAAARLRRQVLFGAAWVVVLVSTSACAPIPVRLNGAEVDHGANAAQLELRLVLVEAPASLADVGDLDVWPEWGGANNGPDRDRNWATVPAVARRIHLQKAAPGAVWPAAVAVARGRVPAGTYRRVYVPLGAAVAHRPDGEPVRLISHAEPIALPTTLTPGGSAVVILELVVLGGSSAEARPAVFVRDAWQVQSASAGRLGRGGEALAAELCLGP